MTNAFWVHRNILTKLLIYCCDSTSSRSRTLTEISTLRGVSTANKQIVLSERFMLHHASSTVCFVIETTIKYSAHIIARAAYGHENYITQLLSRLITRAHFGTRQMAAFSSELYPVACICELCDSGVTEAYRLAVCSACLDSSDPENIWNVGFSCTFVYGRLKICNDDKLILF
jgi:hypothetical protein